MNFTLLQRCEDVYVLNPAAALAPTLTLDSHWSSSMRGDDHICCVVLYMSCCFILNPVAEARRVQIRDHSRGLGSSLSPMTEPYDIQPPTSSVQREASVSVEGRLA